MNTRQSHAISLTGIMTAGVFCAIAVFLIIYTWVPAPQSLTQEQAQVREVVKQPNAWYEASVETESGVNLTCRARKNPLAWVHRCPIEELEKLSGKTITITHHRKTIYTIESAGVILLEMQEHRKAQMTAFVIAAMMLVMAYLALRRA